MAQKTPKPGQSVLDDEALLRKAKNAENGWIFTALFEEGWDSKQVRQLYERPRCAELSLVVRLLWWTRHETAQVNRLFKKSALYNPETDSRRESIHDLVQEGTSLLGDDCYDPHYRRREDQ